MECYAHPNAAAVGVCKTCGKAICRHCARNLDFAVACSEGCAKEATEVNEVMQRAKRMYSIGPVSVRIPLVVTMYSLFGIVLLGWGAHNYWWADRGVEWLLLVFAVLCFVVAALAYRRSIKLGVRY